MYIQEHQNLGEVDGLFSTLKNVISKVIQAPLKVASAAVSGGSIQGAFDKNVTQVVGKGLTTSGALMPALEVVFAATGVGAPLSIGLHAAEAAAALAKLHKQKDAAKAGSAEAIAIQKQIDATQAQIDKLKAADPSYAAKFDNVQKGAQYIPGVPDVVLIGGAAVTIGLLAMLLLRRK